MNLTESVAKILSHEAELSLDFYERFFDRIPQAETFFNGTNMRHQAAVLRMSLQIIEQYFTHRFEAIGDYLRVIGFKHLEREIPQELYAKWRDILLDTLKEFHGGEWTETLNLAWTDALNLSIDTMLEGYERTSASI